MPLRMGRGRARQGRSFPGGALGVSCSLLVLSFPRGAPELGIQHSHTATSDLSFSCFLFSCWLVFHPRPTWPSGSPGPSRASGCLRSTGNLRS